MPDQGFVAIVHGKDEASTARARHLAESFGFPSISAVPLARGSLTLCRREARCSDQQGIVLSLDGTGGAPAVPVPLDCIDAREAPPGLAASAFQHHSYLHVDEAGALALWTDHLGLATIYHQAVEGCHLFSDDAGRLAGLSTGLDRTMVASFLTNGFVLPGRTLFEGIEALPWASVIRLDDHRALMATPYWRFRPGAECRGSRADLAEELWSRIRRAVLAHAGDRHVVLPLSGGNDSTALLGILTGAGCSVSTFSFVLGTPRHGCDADVARRQAARLGVPHEIYPLPAFSVGDLIGGHLHGPLVMRKPCYETRPYAQAALDARQAHPDPLFVFGDECFGQGAMRLRDDIDLMGSWALKDPNVLSWLVPHIDEQVAAEMSADLRQAYDGLLAAIPPSADMERRKDTGFLDLFHRQNMLQLRRFNRHGMGSIAMPFMDIAVLDMARHVPSRLRVEKALFRYTARRHLPDLFSIPRALTAQSQPNLQEAMHGDRAGVLDLARRLSSGIEGVLSGDALVRLADASTRNKPVPPSVRSRAMDRLLRRSYQSTVIPDAVKFAAQRRLWTKFDAGVTAATLLLRALQLAAFGEVWPTGRTAGMQAREPAVRLSRPAA